MKTHLDSSTKLNLSFFIFGLSSQAHDLILLIDFLLHLIVKLWNYFYTKCCLILFKTISSIALPFFK